MAERTRRANRGSYPRIHNLSGLERSYEQFVDQLQEAHELKVTELQDRITGLEVKVRELHEEIVYLESLLAGATDHYTPSHGDGDDV